MACNNGDGTPSFEFLVRKNEARSLLKIPGIGNTPSAFAIYANEFFD